MPSTAPHRTSRLTLLAAITLAGLLLLGACVPAFVPPPPTITPLGPTITPNPETGSSPTPFQPVEDPNQVTYPPTNLPPVILPSDTPFPTDTPAPTATEYIPPTSMPSIPSATVVPGTRTQYYLNAYVDYYAHIVTVGETIYYPNQTGVALGSLVLAVDPNLWYGGFILDAMSMDGQPVTNYGLEYGRLEIPLGLAPGAAVTLSMNYRLVLPYAGASNVYGYNALQMNLLDWYPFVVPYDPVQGWLLHSPSTVGEHLVYDVSDFDVTVNPSDSTLVVAASAPAEWTSQGWHARMTSRTFALSISDSYQAISTSAGPVTVVCYYFPADETAANALVAETAKAVVTYASYFTPYPYQTLSVVEAAAYPDGMEADGMYFLGRKFFQQYTGSVRSNLVTLGVHETAHEWWFASVGSDQALEPWLDEALSLYSEHIFYEVNYPAYVNWWWEFRVNSYSPTGWVDNNIYNAGPFRSYVNSVYLRGADYMDALRLRIGGEAFLAFLKDYATQMAGKRATAEDFFRILYQHTGVDISDINASFFQTPH